MLFKYGFMLLCCMREVGYSSSSSDEDCGLFLGKNIRYTAQMAIMQVTAIKIVLPASVESTPADEPVDEMLWSVCSGGSLTVGIGSLCVGRVKSLNRSAE